MPRLPLMKTKLLVVSHTACTFKEDTTGGEGTDGVSKGKEGVVTKP
jgi:hypothetical protein